MFAQILQVEEVINCRLVDVEEAQKLDSLNISQHETQLQIQTQHIQSLREFQQQAIKRIVINTQYITVLGQKLESTQQQLQSCTQQLQTIAEAQIADFLANSKKEAERLTALQKQREENV
jgi:replicative DNA helicase